MNYTLNTMQEQFVDSGCTAEVVGQHYAQRRKLKLEKLPYPIYGKLMDGKTTIRTTHLTRQTIAIKGTNGTKRFNICYYVIPSDEAFVLGHRWLSRANPIIDWQENQITWRKPMTLEENIAKGLILRKTKIQSEIPANEAPEWVRRHYSKVFDDDIANNRLPRSRGELDYSFKLREHQPWVEPPRWYTPYKRALIRAWKEKELAGGRWVPSNSPYRCQLHIGANDRVCCDYQPLNKHMVGDQWPIPNLRDMIQDVAQAKFISSLDMPKGYNQVRIKEAFRKYMAVEIDGGLYEPTVMQFGSKTAVPWFQRIVSQMLAKYINRGIKVYLDNIVVYANTQEEHDRLLKWTLEQLIKEGFPLSEKKCEWSKQEVLVGGFFVGNGRIRTDPTKIKAIAEWPEPQNHTPQALAKWSREFIGFINYIKDDLKGMSQVAAPLTDMQKKDFQGSWNDTRKKAFAMLKAMALAAPILAAFDERLPLRVYTDASDKGLGAHYTQVYHCGHEMSVGFYSKKLNPAQQNYHTTERELMAIVFALEHIRTWAHMARDNLTVLTDHKALVKFMEKRKWIPRLERWGVALLEYMPKIEFIAGKDNIAADALSRQWGGEKNDNQTRIIDPRMIKHEIDDCDISGPIGKRAHLAPR